MSSLEPAQSARGRKSGYAPGEVRRSVWFIILAWFFGAGFFALATGATFISFVSEYLRADDVSFGLIMAAGPAAVFFQFLGSYVIERTGKTRTLFLWFVSLHRLLWLGMAAIAYYLPVSSSEGQRTAIVLAGMIAFLSASLGNFGGAGWAKWMGDIVPRSVAGKLFGYRARLGMLAMIVMSSLAAYALDTYDKAALIYVMVFVAAAILGTIDILLFIFVRELPHPRPAATPSMAEIIITPWKHAGFRAYAVYTMLVWISYTLMGPFLWPFCFTPRSEHGLGLTTGMTNLFLFVLPLLANAWVAPYWGAAIDRFGPRPVLTVSTISACVLPIVWVVMRPELVWLIPVQCFVAGLFWPGTERVMEYMLIQGFPATRRSTYVATFNVAFGVAMMLGPALGGLCAAGWKSVLPSLALPGWVSHYHLLFLTSMVARIIVFIVAFPRRTLAGDASPRVITHAVAVETIASMTPRRSRRRSRVVPGRRPS